MGLSKASRQRERPEFFKRQAGSVRSRRKKTFQAVTLLARQRGGFFDFCFLRVGGESSGMQAATAAIVESLKTHRLVDEAVLAEVIRRLPGKAPRPEDLIEELKQRGLLTSFQAQMVLAGKAGELVLGTYVLTDRLGEGGMGQVFKAYHRILKSLRAIKVIRPDRLTSSMAVKRFFREIELVAKLNHPNIIRAYDADQSGDSCYFVMEYAPGRDLGQLVRERGPLPVGEACEYIRQAAEGLQHAFERNLVHRDIKPSNLLLSREDGQVKILDLGLARLSETEVESHEPGNQLTPANALMGTPDYMPPEQAEDARAADIRSDIYALGCSLFQLLTGQVPFPTRTLVDKLLAHLQTPPPPLSQFRSDVPAEVEAIVRKMMAKRPEERYQTPAEVARALKPFTSAIPPTRSSDTNVPIGFRGQMPVQAAPPTADDTARLASDRQESQTARLAGLAGPSPLDASPDATLNTADSVRPLTPFAEVSTGKPLLTPRPTPVVYPPSLPPAEASSETAVEAPPAPPPNRWLGPALVGILLLGGVGTAALLYFRPPSPHPPGRTETRPEPTADTRPRTTWPTPPATRPTFPTPRGPTGILAKGVFSEADRNRAGDVRRRKPERTQTRLPAVVSRAVLSGDGSTALLQLPTGVQLIDSETGKGGRTVRIGDLVNWLVGEAANVDSLTLSDDGQTIVLGTVIPAEKAIKMEIRTAEFDTLLLWKPDEPVRLFHGKVPVRKLQALTQCLALTRDGKWLLAGTTTGVDRWPVTNETRTLYPRDGVQTGEVTAIAVSLDDKLAAVGTRMGKVHLVTLEGLKISGERTVAESRVLALALTRELVVAGDATGNLVVLRQTTPPNEPALLHQLKSWHDGKVNALACSPDGKWFASGGADGLLRVGSLETGKEVHKLKLDGEVLAVRFDRSSQQVIAISQRSIYREPVVPLIEGESRDLAGPAAGLARGKHLGSLAGNPGTTK